MKFPKENILSVLDDINKYTQYLSDTIEDFRSFFKGDMTQVKRFNLRDTLEKIQNLTRDSFSHSFISFIDEESKEDIFIEKQ